MDRKFFQVGDARKICMAVLINNFVITEPLLISGVLDSGSKRIHAIRCKEKSKHSPCFNLKAEGFLHKEGLEQINRSVFSQIKEEKEEREEANAEIIREQNKIKNPEEKSRIENGDTIETDKQTQAVIADSAGNKMWIGGKSAVKINGSSNFELLIGTITAFIKILKATQKFEIKAPIAVAGLRGTCFSLWGDGKTISLTVVEGEVEFSDLKGNKAIVKSTQTCLCSNELDLQHPITVPINPKEQFEVYKTWAM